MQEETIPRAAGTTKKCKHFPAATKELQIKIKNKAIGRHKCLEFSYSVRENHSPTTRKCVQICVFLFFFIYFFLFSFSFFCLFFCFVLPPSCFLIFSNIKFWALDGSRVFFRFRQNNNNNNRLLF